MGSRQPLCGLRTRRGTRLVSPERFHHQREDFYTMPSSPISGVDGQQHVILKIGAFRDFASSLAGQLVEQCCQEFEREVSCMYNDLVIYRAELERLAELLGQQVGREKDLHMRLSQMGELHSSSVQQIESLARQTPDARTLHDLVEQMHSGHLSVTSAHLNGASQSQQAAANHVQQAQQLQQPLITAENEYNRIVQLLSQPLIPGVNPTSPTIAPAQISGGNLNPRLRSSATGQQVQLGQPMVQTTPLSPGVTGVPVRGPLGAAPMVVVQGPPMVVSTATPGPPMAAAMTYATPTSNGLFDRIDSNHDGKISRAEFQRALG